MMDALEARWTALKITQGTPVACVLVGLAVWGLLCVACIGYIQAVMYAETHQPPRFQAIVVSPTAQKIAAKIAPGLQEVARDYEPTFIAHAGGPLERMGTRWAYPVVVREIPTAAEIGADHLLSHFGSLSVRELVGLVVDHAAAKGEKPHDSLMLYEAGVSHGGQPVGGYICRCGPLCRSHSCGCGCPIGH